MLRPTRVGRSKDARIEEVERLDATVTAGLPFRVEDRRDALRKIGASVKDGTLAPSRAATRVWAWIEDELRLTRENGLYRQVISVAGSEVLADVARLGMTMMYFRTLINGMAELPPADTEIRDAIDQEAAERGWSALHEMLAVIDPTSAARINPNDSQRIQRALEVYRQSGKSLTDWHESSRPPRDDLEFIRMALVPEPRKVLHERIEHRLDAMLEAGASEPWQATLEKLTGTREMDASAIIDYFRPLMTYLEEQNQGRSCGW